MTAWRKSSHSGTNQSACLEVAVLPNGIGLRNSKSPAAGHLTASPHCFAALLQRIRNS